MKHINKQDFIYSLQKNVKNNRDFLWLPDKNLKLRKVNTNSWFNFKKYTKKIMLKLNLQKLKNAKMLKIL